MCPFERLGLPGRFSIDADELERAYLARSRDAHPDFHAGSEEAEIAAAEINRAYGILKDPYRRAEALLQRLGGPAPGDSKEIPAPFLMEMLELRERIELADAVERDAIERELVQRESDLFATVAKLLERCEPLPADPILLSGIRKELNGAKYLRGLLRDLRNP
jgi:molecular chaperone HscB